MESAAVEGLQRYGNDPILKFYVGFAKVLQSESHTFVHLYIVFIQMISKFYQNLESSIKLMIKISALFYLAFEKVNSE